MIRHINQSHETDELSSMVKDWWGMESFGTNVHVEARSKDDRKSLEKLAKETLFENG